MLARVGASAPAATRQHRVELFVDAVAAEVRGARSFGRSLRLQPLRGALPSSRSGCWEWSWKALPR
eukprot:1152431-Alexandrium_andersonii.AAC.1